MENPIPSESSYEGISEWKYYKTVRHFLLFTTVLQINLVMSYYSVNNN